MKKSVLNVLKSRYKQNENEIDEKLCRKICREAYPSLEEKAANLLYFMIKDHPYSDGALVALTLMIAESRPDEKDIMVALVMNILEL